MTAAITSFQHGAIALSLSDLAQIKANLSLDPWKTAYAALVADGHSKLTYTMQGPFAQVTRNPDLNLAQWRSDMQASWNLSRMWYFTGNSAYAQKAHDILIAWSSTQTSFGGNESNLDEGDYAYRWAGAADLLRSTWSGWSQTDTDTVKAYFNNVLWPGAYGGQALGPANKGNISLEAMASIAVFNDDADKLNTVVDLFTNDAASGLLNTLSNGEEGESMRDGGHAYGQLNAMAYVAEVLWKQGIDVYSALENRILAVGEYTARYNLGVSTPYTPMGTTDALYLNPTPTAVGWNGDPMGYNILQGAYSLRMGLSSPYIDQKVAAGSQGMDSFMSLKNADSSTATPVFLSYPQTASVTTGLTNVEVNGATPAGDAVYSNGTWTVAGGYNGGDPWGTGSDTFHYAYKQVTGDVTMIAKVSVLGNASTNDNAGIMLRDSLSGTPGTKAWIAITPQIKFESYMKGWTSLFGGSNWAGRTQTVPTTTYWIRLDHIGNKIITYTSPDGVSWATAGSAQFANTSSTVYLGLFVTSLKTGTLSTTQFTDVQMTGGDGLATPTRPTAPFDIYGAPGDSQVPLRWLPSCGATDYNIKRATIDGGPYTTIATVSGTSYIDRSVVNGSKYYYVVTASNAAGESASSLQDVVAPAARLVNVAVGGVAAASANGSSSTEGAAKAFDKTTGTKWFENSGPTGWISYDLGAGAARVVTQYDLYSGNDVPGRDPKDWQFQASNNGSSWVTLDTKTNQSFATYRNLAQHYAISNSTAYRYYRLNITANNGNATGIQLAELGLMVNPLPTIAVAAAASPSPASGTTANLSVLGSDDYAESGLTYNWSAVGPASVVYSTNGNNAAKNTTVTFTKAGTYNFQVALTDASGNAATSTVSVTVNQTLTRIHLTPPTTTLAANATQQFAAAAFDQFGDNLAVQPTVVWFIGSGAGSISAGGLYTAPATAGTATVAATNGSISATASNTTNAPVLVAPSNLAAVAASSSQINVTWTDNSTNENGFVLDRATNSAFTSGSVSTTVAANVTSLNVTSLIANTYYYFRVRAFNASGSSSNTATVSVRTKVATITYQAEAATIGGGTTIDNNYSAYTGTGFANLPRANGYVEFGVTAPSAGTYTLSFRYALGNLTSRSAAVSLNGTAIAGGVNFVTTNGWNKWSTVTLTVSLSAGLNQVRLTSNGHDAGNIDSLTVAEL